MNFNTQSEAAAAVREYIERMVESFVSSKNAEDDLQGLHSTVMDCIEARLLQTVVKRCKGNKARAAKVLGLHRNTLAQKLEAVREVKDGPLVKAAAKRVLRPRSPLRQAAR